MGEITAAAVQVVGCASRVVRLLRVLGSVAQVALEELLLLDAAAVQVALRCSTTAARQRSVVFAAL